MEYEIGVYKEEEKVNGRANSNKRASKLLYHRNSLGRLPREDEA